MFKKTLLFSLVIALCGTAQGNVTFFTRNSFSIVNLSDVPVASPVTSGAFAPPLPGVHDGFAGAPDTSNTKIGNAVIEESGAKEEATQKSEENPQDRELRDRDIKEKDVRERDIKERDIREKEGKEAGPKDKESQEKEDRERETRDRQQKEQEQKERERRSKEQKGYRGKGRGTDSVPKGKQQDKNKMWRERTGQLDVPGIRLADAPPASMSDMPRKYLTTKGDIPLPFWPIPATTIGTPSAHGADWSDVFAGVGVQNRARYGNLANGTAIVGLGIGDSIKNVGLEIGISSFGLIRHGAPFSIGGVSLKLHHYFQDWQLGMAAGYENAIYWGVPDSGQSFFLVFSKFFLLGKGSVKEPFKTLFVHVGFGDGRFRSENAVRDKVNNISPFLAVAMRAADPVNLIANWTGSDLAFGVSLTPFRDTPISIGFSALDILKQAGDGVRFSLVFSYGDSVKNPSFPVSWFR